MSTPRTDLYIGLMSGTSMDSMDAALASFSDGKVQLLATEKKIVPVSTKKQLLSLCDSFDSSGRTSRPKQLEELDLFLANEFSDLVRHLLSQQSLSAPQITAIGSHGQTVFHLPPTPDSRGFSLQIGNPQQIATSTGIKTVGNFRNADMRVGGQGAPLVPALHRAIFHVPDKNRVIVNIGGMANITILPARGKVNGFDTGPGNVLMDAWIFQYSQHLYDAEGAWAARETPDHELLDRLSGETYFQLAPPKSTGRELFNLSWLEKHLALLHRPVSPAAVQATLATLTAMTISDAIRQYANNAQEIFVCGGGAHNTHLMKLLQQHTHLPVHSTAALGVDPDWVEALAFAWLAKQHLAGLPGNLPEVTGAQEAVVLGELYLP